MYSTQSNWAMKILCQIAAAGPFPKPTCHASIFQQLYSTVVSPGRTYLKCTFSIQFLSRTKTVFQISKLKRNLIHILRNLRGRMYPIMTPKFPQRRKEMTGKLTTSWKEKARTAVSCWKKSNPCHT